MQLPDRSTLAAGLASVVGWAIVKYAIPLACGAAGGVGAIVCGIVVNITPAEWAAGVGTIATLASHFTPDSLKDIAKKLNTDVVSLGQILPTTFEEYPGDVAQQKVTTNLTTQSGEAVD